VDQVELRIRALELAANTYMDNKMYPLSGQTDARTARIVDAAKSFEAFLLGEVSTDAGIEA
jgi:hypothetical protein